MLDETSAGEALKERGQSRVASHNSEWVIALRKVILQVAAAKLEFTVDDVRDAAEVLGIGEPDHDNTWGSVMNSAAVAGDISFANHWIKSRRKKGHARPIRVWTRKPRTVEDFLLEERGGDASGDEEEVEA